MTTSEALKRAQRKYYLLNRKKIIARTAKYYREHLESCRAYGRNYMRLRTASKKKNIETNSDTRNNKRKDTIEAAKNRLLEEINTY